MPTKAARVISLTALSLILIGFPLFAISQAPISRDSSFDEAISPSLNFYSGQIDSASSVELTYLDVGAIPAENGASDNGQRLEIHMRPGPIAQASGYMFTADNFFRCEDVTYKATAELPGGLSNSTDITPPACDVINLGGGAFVTRIEFSATYASDLAKLGDTPLMIVPVRLELLRRSPFNATVQLQLPALNASSLNGPARLGLSLEPGSGASITATPKGAECAKRGEFSTPVNPFVCGLSKLTHYRYTSYRGTERALTAEAIGAATYESPSSSGDMVWTTEGGAFRVPLSVRYTASQGSIWTVDHLNLLLGIGIGVVAALIVSFISSGLDTFNSTPIEPAPVFLDPKRTSHAGKRARHNTRS
jgi:hypothetical protein